MQLKNNNMAPNDKSATYKGLAKVRPDNSVTVSVLPEGVLPAHLQKSVKFLYLLLRTVHLFNFGIFCLYFLKIIIKNLNFRKHSHEKRNFVLIPFLWHTSAR